MKTTLLIAMLLSAIALYSAEPTQTKPRSVAGTGKLTFQDIDKLRQEARSVFGTLPDKMPGSEKDTPQRIELGRKLYFDQRLSANESMSCNSCHRLDNQLSGAEEESTSSGAFGKRGDRNAPTVLNAGFHVAQFWDGRAANLKEQAKGPVLNPIEMAMPNPEEVVKRIGADTEYRTLFAAAFPGDAPNVTYDNIAEAIAAFERTLKTDDRFDDFLRGDNRALSTTELRGLALFLKTGCATCHNGPPVGGQIFQKVGLVQPYENTQDLGRYAVTKHEEDKFRFKVPSLRNVALTMPYFHDGKVAALEQAVKKMSAIQLGQDLTPEETDQISAFLHSLSGKKRVPTTQIK